jgi:hypothetical protein
MTTRLSAENVAKMRAVQESNLPETAYIQRVTVTNGADGFSEAWTTVSTVNARLGEPKGEMERQIASTITVGKVYVITLPVGTSVLDTDQIQISSVNYRVHWTNKNKSHATAMRVLVTEA